MHTLTNCENTPGKARLVSFITLGCAKNEVDTADMATRLREAGHIVIDDAQAADVVIVNTCSFIQSATEESLDTIFEVADLPRVASGEAALVVAGCMPARYGDDLAGELSEARAFVPCSKEDDIVAIVEGLAVNSLALTVELEEDEGQAPSFAYVKISDGCDRWCSYCTIPLIRGRYHSFSYEEVRSAFKARVDEGVSEVCLIAQDTGKWGSDFAIPDTLASLVERLALEFPQTWIRIMYLQPEGISDQLLKVIAAYDNVCPYIDMPLQHVDPLILKSMNRTGSREEFEACFERIFAIVPDMTLRTTLIAGFPGETEEQFEALCDFVEDAPFSYVGVFPYSREEGTRAYDLPGQLDEDEKAQRAQQLRDLSDSVCASRIALRIGSSQKVLIDGVEEDGQVYGRCQCQAPEVDGVTFVPAGVAGEFVDVQIIDTLMYEMEGE